MNSTCISQYKKSPRLRLESKNAYKFLTKREFSNYGKSLNKWSDLNPSIIWVMYTSLGR